MKKVPWKISVDDGHVEYQYTVLISDQECINSVYEKIQKVFSDRPHAGKRRKGEKE